MLRKAVTWTVDLCPWLLSSRRAADSAGMRVLLWAQLLRPGRALVGSVKTAYQGGSLLVQQLPKDSASAWHTSPQLHSGACILCSLGCKRHGC